MTQSATQAVSATRRRLFSRIKDMVQPHAVEKISAAVLAAFAVIAIVFARITELESHRWWAIAAAIAYACAAVASLARQLRLAIGVAALGSVAVPLIVLVAMGKGQPEVFVVKQSAADFLATGSPWSTTPDHLNEFNPYGPVMALFGIPAHVLDGHFLAALGDPRFYFLLSSAALMIWAWRLAVGKRKAGRQGLVDRDFVLMLLALAAVPVTAISAVVGGVDLPVAAAITAAMVAGFTGHERQAGFLAAVAIGMKWMVLPVAALIFAVLLCQQRWRHAARYLGWFTALTVLVHIPAILHYKEFLVHTIIFPAGRAVIMTPAGRSLAGMLLEGIPQATIIAPVCLGLAGLAFAWWVWRKPPHTLSSLLVVAAAGMSTMFGFSPSFRFGYFVYPIFFLWFAAVIMARPVFYATSASSAGSNEKS